MRRWPGCDGKLKLSGNGPDEWNNHDDVIVNVIFKFSDGSDALKLVLAADGSGQIAFGNSAPPPPVSRVKTTSG